MAQTKSITLSARRLFISQQGLSQIILRLEHELKVPLLNRHRQGVTLTEDGEMVVKKAQEILQKYEELQLSLQPFTRVDPQSLTGKLAIGVVPSISSNLLPDVLNLFYKQFPSVEVHIHEKQPDDIREELNNGDLDIGLAIIPDFLYSEQSLNSDLTYKIFYREEMFVVASKDSPVAKKKTLTKKEFYQYPIVLYNHEVYLNIINHLFPDQNQLNIIGETNSINLFKNALINRQAVSITASTDVKLLNDVSLVTIPLKESVNLYYVYITPGPTSSVEEMFINVLRYYITTKLHPIKSKKTD